MEETSPCAPGERAVPDEPATVAPPPAGPLTVEEHPLGDDADWVAVVLPTEGYSVDIPVTWLVSGHTQDGGSMLSATAEDGSGSVTIRRLASPRRPVCWHLCRTG